MVLAVIQRLRGISVVLPALNEEGNVGVAVRRSYVAARRLSDRVEVVVVDDGSTDGTANEARRAGARVISHPQNRGYGAALRSGFAAARYPWIFQMDCDNQFDPDELEKLVSLSRDAQVVIGIRADRADQRRRIWAGRAWNYLCRLAFGFIVSDVDCGFKLLNRDVITAVDLTSNGAGISLELCVAARSAGFKIAEVEVHHHPRTTGSPTGLRWPVVLRGLYELFSLHRRYNRRSRSVRVATTAKAEAHR